MQWWTEFTNWLGSNDARDVLLNVVLPFVAILIAGIVAAAIGRGSTKRLITLNDRENRVSAVATMIGAARRASVWNTLSAPEQQHADHVASEADVRVRLLAVQGSSLAADWAAHELLSMKKNSVSFSFQAEQSLMEFRDRMVTWQAKPNRARKLFKNDLDLWAYEDSQQTNDIVSQQQAWAAAQVATETGPISTVKASESDVVAARPAESFAPAMNRPSAPAVTTASEVHPTVESQRDEASAPAEAPELVEPDEKRVVSRDSGPVSTSSSPSSSSSSSSSGDDDEDDRDLSDAIYSPVTANAVTKRNNPPKVGDDGRKY